MSILCMKPIALLRKCLEITSITSTLIANIYWCVKNIKGTGVCSVEIPFNTVESRDEDGANNPYRSFDRRRAESTHGFHYEGRSQRTSYTTRPGTPTLRYEPSGWTKDK